MRQAPAISPAAARPIIPAIPVATDSDTRPGDGNAPYPRIPPTARPTRYHLLSPTARQGGHTPQYHPPYRLWRPPRLSTLPPTATTGRGIATALSAHFPNCRADQMPSALPHSAAGVHTPRYRPPYRLSPLPPTAMLGWGMATPPIRAFPQRHPARSTPCKPKGSVLQRFIGPGGRARQAKKCIGLRVGGAKRVAASKSRIAAEKKAGPIPLAVVLQGAMAVAIGKKGGRCRDLSPPPGGPCKTRSLFPPRCQIGAVGIPHQAVCPCLRPCPGSPGRQPHIAAAPLLQRPLPSGHGKLLCPQWSAPFCRAVRLPATEIAGKPGRGRTSPLPDRGSSAPCVDFAGAAPYNIGWFIV